MKVLQLIVPHGIDFNKVVHMFRYAGCKVDDLCSATRQGRVIDVWISEEDLTDKSLDEHPGFFLGEA